MAALKPALATMDIAAPINEGIAALNAVSAAHKEKTLPVILTGMGNDG